VADGIKGTQLEGIQSKEQLEVALGSYYEANTRDAVRDALSQAIGVYCLLRGDNQRSLEFSDMFCKELEEEGPTRCPVVIMTLRQGKTIKDGHIGSAAFLRNKNVFVCPVFCLAAHLFSRYVRLWHRWLIGGVDTKFMRINTRIQNLSAGPPDDHSRIYATSPIGTIFRS
jgi:hypothetical protein